MSGKNVKFALNISFLVWRFSHAIVGNCNKICSFILYPKLLLKFDFHKRRVSRTFGLSHLPCYFQPILNFIPIFFHNLV